MLRNPNRLASIVLLLLLSFSCAAPLPAVSDPPPADARKLSATSPLAFDTKSEACAWVRERVRRSAARECKLAAYSAPRESCECGHTGGRWSRGVEAAYVCQ